MLMNQVSVNDMNKKIGNSTISIENFRPNIVVDGPNLEPYAEDNWDWIKIGDGIILRNVKECTRCIFTTINADTGVRNANREPFKTLSTYVLFYFVQIIYLFNFFFDRYRSSAGPESSPVMGANMGVVKTGFVSTGDTVYISKKKQE